MTQALAEYAKINSMKNLINVNTYVMKDWIKCFAKSTEILIFNVSIRMPSKMMVISKIVSIIKQYCRLYNVACAKVYVLKSFLTAKTVIQPTVNNA